MLIALSLSPNTAIGLSSRLATAAVSWRFSKSKASGSSPGCANFAYNSCSAVLSCAGAAEPEMPWVESAMNGEAFASLPASCFCRSTAFIPAAPESAT